MDDSVLISIRQWLRIANEDLIAAKRAIEIQPYLTRNACYSAQQCAEKAVKAYLVSQKTKVPRIHDITELMMSCTENDEEFKTMLVLGDKLTGYAVTTRYPDDWREIPLEEATEAVDNAQKVLDFVKGKLEQYF